jgi:hypothetical protein
MNVTTTNAVVTTHTHTMQGDLARRDVEIVSLLKAWERATRLALSLRSLTALGEGQKSECAGGEAGGGGGLGTQATDNRLLAAALSALSLTASILCGVNQRPPHMTRPMSVFFWSAKSRSHATASR